MRFTEIDHYLEGDGFLLILLCDHSDMSILIIFWILVFCIISVRENTCRGPHMVHHGG